jgi:hypothetical protein
MEKAPIESRNPVMKPKKLNHSHIKMLSSRPVGRRQRIEITKFPDRHFWHRGYDKAYKVKTALIDGYAGGRLGWHWAVRAAQPIQAFTEASHGPSGGDAAGLLTTPLDPTRHGGDKATARLSSV